MKGKQSLVSLLMVLGTLFLIPAAAVAETSKAVGNAVEAPVTVCGEITATHWTVAESPYIVTCDASLSSGTLVVEPGVEVRFRDGTRLDVSGTLQVDGTEDDPVIFTSDSASPAAGDWSGLHFHAGSSNTVLRYLVLEYGTGTSVEHASPLIEYSTIRHNASSGLYLDHSSSTIAHSTIVHNSAYIGGGVYALFGAVTLDSNIISWNSSVTRGGGVSGFGWYGWASDATLTLRRNTITHNSTGSYCGGGVLFDSIDGLIEENVITDNSAGVGDGGGVCAGGASGPEVTIRNNLIASNEAVRGGGIGGDARMTIAGNIIAENRASLAGGGVWWIGWYFPHIPVTCNTIIGNKGPADSGNGVYTAVPPAFHQNAIFDNDGYQFEASSDYTVLSMDATNNYWGTTGPVEIEAGILDQSDDPSRPAVTHEPFLHSPDVCMPGLNSPPTVAVNQPVVSVLEGATATAAGTVSDPDGDPVVLSASVGDVIGDNDGTWFWSFPTHNGPAESQTVTIYADDGNGGAAEVSFELIVYNVAPTIDSVTAPVDPFNINEQPISVEVAFSDPGTADTHDVTWDWGDLNSDTQTKVTSPATHVYSYVDAGVYRLTITVTDSDGGSDTETYEFIVIYDPEGGFVTGGGWFDSPEGAYAPDPSLTGPASFGFVSKYKKGAQAPTGQTEFQFKAGNLNLHSGSYDWLVVAGHKAKYKGTGTVNGMGNYGFMLSAVDAKLTPSTDVDLFRIRNLDKDSGDAVVYDNLFGADDDADPTTAISGGNIVIHKAK